MLTQSHCYELNLYANSAVQWAKDITSTTKQSLLCPSMQVAFWYEQVLVTWALPVNTATAFVVSDLETLGVDAWESCIAVHQVSPVYQVGWTKHHHRHLQHR